MLNHVYYSWFMAKDGPIEQMLLITWQRRCTHHKVDSFLVLKKYEMDETIKRRGGSGDAKDCRDRDAK